MVRRIAVLAGGTAGAQAITLAATPFVTRLYGPESIGLLGTYAAVLAIASPAAALALPLAIPLPEKEQTARSIARLSVLCAAAFCLVVALGASAAHLWEWQDNEFEVWRTVASWVAIGLLFAALGEVLRYWLVREHAFQTIAYTTLAASAFINGLKLAFGYVLPTGAALIGITVLGAALQAILMLPRVWASFKDHISELFRPNLGKTLQLLKVYKDYPLYRAPQNIISAASQGFPVILLTLNFGAAAAGYYSVSAILMGAPSSLLGTAVRDVFYPHLAEAGRRGSNLYQPLRRATLSLIALCLIPFICIAIFGPAAFRIALGPTWGVAGEYARWVSLFFFLRLVVRPAVAAVPILGLERGLLVYEVATTGVKFAAMALAIVVFKSDLVAIASFSVVGAASYSILIAWILSRARQSRGQLSS